MCDQQSIRSLTSLVLERCDRLARHSQDPHRLARTFLSPPMRAVHCDVAEWMAAAGMSVRVDGLGNIVGRRDGTTPGAPALLIGSHLDTVPDAGKFDGILGVMLGLAVAEAVGGRLPIAIEVVGFSEEEGVRFATPYLGSKWFVGQLEPEALDLRDATGVSVAGAARAFGLEPTPARFDPSRYLGYVEAHIEQGPVLEASGRPLGVVSAISGQSRRTVRFTGRAAHAGTTPMSLRKDALVAAAAWATQVEAMANAIAGAVATLGCFTPSPGASNVVPGLVEASLDVRHPDDATRTRLTAQILSAGEAIAAERSLSFDVPTANDHPTVPMNARFVELLKQAVGEDTWTLASGAGHDAAVLAGVMPACMLFLRSPGGVSHHPDERVYAADVERALAAMVRFAEALADQPTKENA